MGQKERIYNQLIYKLDDLPCTNSNRTSYIVNRLIVNELNRKLFFYFTSNAASINAFKFR